MKDVASAKAGVGSIVAKLVANMEEEMAAARQEAVATVKLMKLEMYQAFADMNEFASKVRQAAAAK